MRKKYVFCALAAAVLLAACSRQKNQFVRFDDAAAAELSGRWERRVTADSEIHNDMDNPDAAAGTVRFVSAVTFEIRPDKTFSVGVRQEFVRYTPLSDAGLLLDEEDLRKVFSSSLLMSGTYSAGKSLLRLAFADVELNDGTKMPYEKYLELYPETGAAVQTSEYKIEDDVLRLRIQERGEYVESSYTRVE